MTAVATPARVRVPDPGPPTRVRVPRPASPTRVRLPRLDTPTRVRLPRPDTPTRVSLPDPSPPTRVRVPRAGRAPMADLSAPEGAEERGGLTIEERVVGRVAGYAVLLVPGAAAPPTRVLGVNIGDADADGEARVRARVDGGTAVVQATIAVGWPTSIRSVVERVRESVVREVGATTGVHVDHVDVDVVSLTVPTTSQRRVR